MTHPAPGPNPRREQRAKLYVALFFLLLLIIGLWTSPDYGLPCDEPWEQEILRENMKEYAIQIWGEESETARYYDSLSIQRISESLERDHGQSAYYLATPLLQLQDTNPHLMTTLWHMYTWLWFMAGCWAIYAFGREMGWCRPVSCFATLLQYLAPRFFAEGHYNNKDVVLLVLVLLTLWLGLRFLKKKTLPRGLLFSLMGAMAGNTKIVGLLPWGLVGLCALVLVTARKEWTLRKLGIALGTVVGFLDCYGLLTPALWADPLGYVRHALLNAAGFTRWPGVVLFRGMVFDHAVNPLPRYYLPVMIIFTLPLYTLPLAAVGQLSALNGWRKAKKPLARDAGQLMLVAVTLAWLIPLGYAMLTRPLVYNGWRHFYFVYGGIVLLGGQGIHALHGLLMRKRPGLLPLGAFLLCLCFLLSALGIGLNHPYQYGYYNAMARPNAQRDMELDYWDVSTVNAMERLVALPTGTTMDTASRRGDLPLYLSARDPMSEFGITWGHTVLPGDVQQALTVAEGEPEAPYLFYNTTYARIYGVAPPEGYRILFTIESYGNVLCTLYERME